VGTGDCRLIAIDAATAKKIWEATVCEPLQTGITARLELPRGESSWATTASDDGVRGALAAYDAETARKSGGSGPFRAILERFRNKRPGMASKTWFGEGSWKIGGGDVWHAITYDDATGLVIFGTAGADVGYGEMTGVKITGEKLFSQCIIAVKPDTGEYVCIPDRHRGHALRKTTRS